MNPKVSVLVAAYNEESNIEATIRTVMNQTLQNIEIIIVNDGSKDNTLNIIKKLAAEDSRIKYIDKENEGLGYARNTAIEIAKGEYVHLCDADDFMEDDFLEYLVESADKYNSDVVISNHKFFVDGDEETIHNGKIPESLKESEVTNISKNKDLLLTPCHVWDKLYRLSFIKDIKFTKPGGEDIFFFWRWIHQAERISILKESKFIYRVRANSIQTNYNYALGVFENINNAKNYVLNEQPNSIDSFRSFIKLIISHISHKNCLNIKNDKKFAKVLFEKLYESIKGLDLKAKESDYDSFYYINNNLCNSVIKHKYKRWYKYTTEHLSANDEIKRKYLKYKILSKITFGKLKKKFKNRKNHFRYHLDNHGK
jgi:glycosyltransferase involved in cell wall biosynthesis